MYRAAFLTAPSAGAFLRHCAFSSRRYCLFPAFQSPPHACLLSFAMPTADAAKQNRQMSVKASRILQVLNELYPTPPKSFLNHRDPFTLLIAVVLSAQSLDSVVNTVTPALFAAASTPQEMVALGVSKVQNLIHTVGLAPRKAKGIIGLSEIICKNHNGQVPQTMEELIKLPSVGRKTASVVLMQAFNVPSFPVDTHIHRLACRWGIGDSKSVEKTEMALREWFPDEKLWARLHVQLISFGREYCPARNHDMITCPICSFAATEEAWKLNSKSPGKFVAAQRHKDPYSVRSKEEVKRLQGLKRKSKGTMKSEGDDRHVIYTGLKRGLRSSSSKDARRLAATSEEGDEANAPLKKKKKVGKAVKTRTVQTRRTRSQMRRNQVTDATGKDED